VTEGDATSVVPSGPWLSQGDVFRSVLIGRVVIAKSQPAGRLDRGPAMLVTADCVLDKKTGRGRSTVEYLNFVPLQDVKALDPGRARNLRDSAGELAPYAMLYIGEVEGVGESYAPLAQVFTLPALFLRTELHAYTQEETGEPDVLGSNTRLRASMGDTRVGRVDGVTLRLLKRKWASHYLGVDPMPD
jgi:hypothetical protein